ncbi:hypothetical protein ElyMa_004693700 [Elysia marginata]|uniref:Uncharacterized protein n=1 Tax=Elysia marginata TaxID=1093978 RepID=A0AAV4I6D4_9GAST|nr:hypothetical protein ElyMa_004693700 [Elysia marginata]
MSHTSGALGLEVINRKCSCRDMRREASSTSGHGSRLLGSMSRESAETKFCTEVRRVDKMSEERGWEEEEKEKMVWKKVEGGG